LKPVITNECNFAEWSINARKRSVLIETVAYLYLRQEENAQRVIQSLEPQLRTVKEKVAQNVVRKLTAPHQKDIDLQLTGSEEEKAAATRRIETSIIHRDGFFSACFMGVGKNHFAECIHGLSTCSAGRQEV